MNILYVGDVMGQTGIQVIDRILPNLRKEKNIDLVIAQAENVSEGKGITPADFKRLLISGVDFCSGGNHTFDQKSIFPALNDPAQPIIRPANYPKGTPGLGWKYINTVYGMALVVSLMGQVVGKNATTAWDNPLQTIDDILNSQKTIERVATVVNFHGDYSSEKVIIGHYLDGRATLVVGDHWHVPTADARILPGGTAHVTDVGMCGVLNSSLGVTFESVIPRWRDNKVTRNVLETKGPRQFNAVLVEANERGPANNIERIQIIYD